MIYSKFKHQGLNFLQIYRKLIKANRREYTRRYMARLQMMPDRYENLEIFNRQLKIDSNVWVEHFLIECTGQLRTLPNYKFWLFKRMFDSFESIFDHKFLQSIDGEEFEKIMVELKKNICV